MKFVENLNTSSLFHQKLTKWFLWLEIPNKAFERQAATSKRSLELEKKIALNNAERELEEVERERERERVLDESEIGREKVSV